MRRAVPMRQCVGCGDQEAQDRLLRFALGPGGTLIPGPGNGRGGYLHPHRECIRTFVSARSRFVRSLRTVVPREARERYVTLIEHSMTL